MSQPTTSSLSLPLLAIVGGTCGLLALWPVRVEAQTIQLDTHLEGYSDAGDSVYRDMNTAAASLSDGASGARWSSGASAVFGSATAAAVAHVPMADNIDFGYVGQTSAYADWIDLFTVTTSPPAAGRLRFTMRFSGAPTASNDAGGSAYNVFCGGAGGVNLAPYQEYQDGSGNPAPPVFTFDVYPYNGGALDGTQFNLQFAVAVSAGARSLYSGGVFGPACSASAAATLGCAGFVVLDDNDQLLDYTAESRAGSARAQSYPAGGTFSSFALTNAAPGRFGSSMQLLGGQASAATQVVAAFVAPPQDNSIKPVSDVVDLSGTNTDPVVIKVDFDPAAAQSFFGSNYFAYLTLAWVQTSTGKWKNAVLGNTGNNAPTFFNRGYNPATDFHLGYFGVDATNKYAWAVVNHNSQFAVTFPPPTLAVRSVTRPSAGLIRLDCTGEPARANRIEVSTNFQPGATLATGVAAGDGTFTYDDAAASGPKRFYRVAYP